MRRDIGDEADYDLAVGLFKQSANFAYVVCSVPAQAFASISPVSASA